MNDTLLKTQLTALKTSPRRNESNVDGNNSFIPTEMVRDGQSKVALRAPLPPKDYITPPINPVVIDPAGVAGVAEFSDDLYKQQRERKEYEEYKKLRLNTEIYAPVHTFFASSTIRSFFLQKILTGDSKLLNIYMGTSIDGVDGNLSSLRMTYHDHSSCEEKPKTIIDPSAHLRPESTTPLDASFDAEKFYANDITLFSEEEKIEFAEFANNIKLFPDLTKVKPRHGEYSSECFVPTEETPTTLLEFRENRKPFSVSKRRQKLENYFAKTYGAEKAKVNTFTWAIKEVEEAVSEEARLKICAENKAKEEKMLQELADSNLIELSEEQKRTYSMRYAKLAKKMGWKSQNFALFITTVTKAVTLQEHLSICAENVVKVKAILASREKAGESVVEFPKTGEWKKTSWNIPSKILGKLTTVNDENDCGNGDAVNTSVEQEAIEMGDAVTPARGIKEVEKDSPTSVLQPMTC
ncbi:hypothetical protein TL16_g01350 [Triparma laevis f. inornata]|uniref:Uncharacterized protein n=1 Tax=Triparma laevis f. inornata TaxID=1714386 RepID=A0A9W6ZMK5_9STRA|nr:hypothetical protein TL16_g01350 [Triparma laevis f. inornata]